MVDDVYYELDYISKKCLVPCDNFVCESDRMSNIILVLVLQYTYKLLKIGTIAFYSQVIYFSRNNTGSGSL